MSDTVRNIITVLVVVVICVVVGAAVINTIAPKATATVVSAVERGIHAATGVEVDIDGSNNNNTGAIKDASDGVGSDIGADGYGAGDAAGGRAGFNGQ